MFYLSVEVWNEDKNLFAGYEPLTGKPATAGETISFAEKWIETFKDVVSIRSLAVMKDGVVMAMWNGSWCFEQKVNLRIEAIKEESKDFEDCELLAELLN